MLKQLLILIPALLLAAGGCMEIPEHSVCESGLICPPHLQCAALQNICIAGPCGNGVIDDSAGETCDDGNLTAGDGCSQECRFEAALPLCGNGAIESGEECDDGNSVDIDTCDACKLVGQLALGGSHTCMRSGDGTVRCWGDGSNGQLGYGKIDNIGDDETPASAGDVYIGGSVIQIAAGSNHTCALLDTGWVRCWGDGAYGQLGYGNLVNLGDNEPPAWAGIVDVGGFVIQLAAGSNHTCALLETGSVRCWGDGAYGQLGYGNTSSNGDNESPAWAGDVDVGGAVIQIAAGGEHTCALLDSGAVRCWGNGMHGQLGYGQIYGTPSDVGDDETPASVGNVDVGGTVIQLAAGGSHTCALLETGSVRCWGDGAYGQLGYGNISSIGDNEPPAWVGDVDVGGAVIQIAAGGEHTCALLDSGAVRCWGNGMHGQLGYGQIYGTPSDVGDDETPASAGNVDVGGTVIQLAAGGSHTCALLGSGSVRCWGYGAYGQLGYGNTSSIGDNETLAWLGDVEVDDSSPGTAGFEHTDALPSAGAAHGRSDAVSKTLDDALHR